MKSTSTTRYGTLRHVPEIAVKNKKKRHSGSLFLTLLLAGVVSSCQARTAVEQPKDTETPNNPKTQWVDSVYQQLSLEEKIGQLFMVAAYSAGKDANAAQIETLLRNHQIGGLIFMQGTPEAQARLTNRFQNMAQVPLLIGMDAEWGLGMRLTGVKDLPKQMMLGATNNPQLVEETAAAIAAQCQRLGVHINFAPDIDINNNPKNPVINFRSFGEDKARVSRLGIAYMQGLQKNGVMACAKHFPGHGDVSVDSHEDLPVITKSAAALNNLELQPFRALIAAGVQSIMIAHLSVPALDNTPHLPTTLSHQVVSKLLKNEMGFEGLIFTDALNMKGVTKYFPEGETDLRAFMAGNDVLLFSQNVPLAIRKIKAALETGEITEARLAHSVKKILAAKYEHGLVKGALKTIVAEGATADLNRMTAAIKEKVSAAALTLVRDKHGLLERLANKPAKVAYIGVNSNSGTTLSNALKQTLPNLSTAWFGDQSGSNTAQTFADRYAAHDVVIIAIHHLNRYPGKSGYYGLTAAQANFVKTMSRKENVVVVNFGNAYLGQLYCAAGTAMVAYEDDSYTETAAFQALTGQLKMQGSLPVSACPKP